MLRIIAIPLFFLSGLSSLIYQVAWQRVLTQEIGIDAVSVATVVAAFLVGLGFGARAGGWVTLRLDGPKLCRFYGAVELLTAIIGASTIAALRAMGDLLADISTQSVALDTAFSLAVIFVPTFLMGMTTPLILHMFRRSLSELGTSVGIYYGANIFGAAVGALLAGFVLIELCGLSGCGYLAAGLNLFVGTVFYVYGRRDAAFQAVTGRPAADLTPQPNKTRLVLLAATCLAFGFVTLSFEMILFRLYSYYLLPEATVFPMMLCAFLMAMAIAQVAGGRLVDLLSSRLAMLAQLVFLLAIVAMGAVMQVSEDTLLKLDVIPLNAFNLSLPFRPFVAICVGMLPVLFLSVFFPLTVKLATQHADLTGNSIGVVLFWFTIGNLAGAIVTPFVLFGMLGTVNAIYISFAVAFLGIALVRILFSGLRRPATWIHLTVVALIAVLGLYTIPRDYYYRFSTWGILGANNVDDGPEQLDETIHGVVGRTNWGSHYYITVNRDPTARVMLRMPKLKDHNFSELRVLDPAFVPKDVLIIGAGTMMYAYGLLQYPDVETVYVAEILPKLLEWQRTLAHSEVRAMFADPRLRPIVGDGRRVIKRLLKDGKKFDLIQVFIKGNRSAGSSNVYSREFGLLLKRAMKSGGYLHTVSSGSVVKSMLSVFKYGFYTNRTLTNHAYFTDSDAHRRIAEQITVPSSLVPHYAAFSRSELRSTLKIPPSLQTLKLFEYGIGDVAKFQMTTDDYPRLEYWRLQQLVGRYDYPNAHPTPQQPPRLIRLTP